MVGTADTTDEKVKGKNNGTKQHLRIISYDNSKTHTTGIRYVCT